MGAEVNNNNPNFVGTVSSTPDGQVVLLLGNRYLDKGKMEAGVSISTNEGGKWSAPKPLEIQNDYNFSDKANYFMTNSRKVLLMSVERDNSRGGRDLYVSFDKENGKWTEPLNLGRVINTAGEESAPFLAADDKTLFFSSNGFSGFGGSDVYMSKRLDDTWTNWSPPENMGPDINTKQDDLFFNIPSNSQYAYYARGIAPNNADVFRVKMPTALLSPDSIVIVKGKLIDAKTGKPIGAKIIFERLPDGAQAGITYSNPETGEYEIRLPGGYLYGFRAEAKDHISESQILDLRDFKKDGSIAHKDISLTPIEENAMITLNNVFFDFDKSILKPESYPELDRIVVLMNNRPTMHVEITGHTDAIGTEAYNLSLSKRRARSVTEFLVKKGIAADRITTTFFGESQLIDKSTSIESNQKNRRVEFKIITL
jgi:outer membrane protein OmpA-like peptidoglycan-associated protein